MNTRGESDQGTAAPLEPEKSDTTVKRPKISILAIILIILLILLIPILPVLGVLGLFIINTKIMTTSLGPVIILSAVLIILLVLIVIMVAMSRPNKNRNTPV